MVTLDVAEPAGAVRAPEIEAAHLAGDWKAAPSTCGEPGTAVNIPLGRTCSISRSSYSTPRCVRKAHTSSYFIALSSHFIRAVAGNHVIHTPRWTSVQTTSISNRRCRRSGPAVRDFIENVPAMPLYVTPCDLASNKTALYLLYRADVLHRLPVSGSPPAFHPPIQPLSENIDDIFAVSLNHERTAGRKHAKSLENCPQLHEVVRSLTVSTSSPAVRRHRPRPTARSGITKAGAICRDDKLTHVFHGSEHSYRWRPAMGQLNARSAHAYCDPSLSVAD